MGWLSDKPWQCGFRLATSQLCVIVFLFNKSLVRSMTTAHDHSLDFDVQIVACLFAAVAGIFPVALIQSKRQNND